MGEIFTNYISGKGLFSRIYQELHTKKDSQLKCPKLRKELEWVSLLQSRCARSQEAHEKIYDIISHLEKANHKVALHNH